ncbi:MAG TPA: O-antigen ligase family protein [Solirubrobacterales bacterium]|nr:O-antigen ligase family protein [Solirubrobacterales bacterium]
MLRTRQISGPPRLDSGRLPLRDVAIAAGIAAIAVVGGAFAVRSLQAAVALALLVLIAAIYSRSRRAGLISLWTLWLLAPALRRMLALAVETPSADPLALLPFIATAGIALVELRRTSMSRPARIAISLATLGFLIGAPAGLAADPLAFGFGLTAYLAGVSALVLGWGDRREGGTLSLVKVLAIGLPPIAVYGVLQYLIPLTSWDSNWVETVDLASIGAPQEGHIRIFATLNSPGTLGLVLAVAIVLGLGLRRRGSITLLATLPLIAALALTFVRSAWLALVLGVIVYAASVRGRTAGKLVAVIAICLAALIVAGGSNPTTRAFTQRITSFGDLGQDESAQDRLKFTQELLPTATSRPIGAGVGQAGLAARLEEGNGQDSLTTTDNGYLALLYQVGPFGFLLVAIAMGMSAVAAVRALGDSEDEASRMENASILAALVVLLVAQAGGDMLYGISGAIFWYLAGVAFASRRRTASQPEGEARQRSKIAPKPLLQSNALPARTGPLP